MSQRGVTLKKETSSVLPTNCPFRPPGRCVQPDGSKAHSVCIAGGGPLHTRSFHMSLGLTP